MQARITLGMFRTSQIDLRISAKRAQSHSVRTALGLRSLDYGGNSITSYHPADGFPTRMRFAL